MYFHVLRLVDYTILKFVIVTDLFMYNSFVVLMIYLFIYNENLRLMNNNDVTKFGIRKGYKPSQHA